MITNVNNYYNNCVTIYLLASAIASRFYSLNMIKGIIEK